MAPPTGPKDTSKPSSGRKRQRPKESKTAKLKEYGLDLPDIPGLPIQVIPLQINALQVTTKFFQQDVTAKTTTVYPYDEPVSTDSATEKRTSLLVASPESRPGEDHSQSVMESIMNRLDESTAALPPEEERLAQERTKRKKDAIQSWLEAIHRCVRDQRKPGNNNNNNDDNNRHGGGKASVPLAALQHLWDVGQSHKRLTVRRAALHCAGHLLQKSSDCRRWLFQEGSFFVDWMDKLAAASTKADHQGPEPAASSGSRIRLWQREAFLLLQNFLDQGYGDLYPTLIVGMQRLKQTCPMVVVVQEDAASGGDSATTTRIHTMADWRRLRDVAIQYVKQEEECVRKLIQRAQACMDILVPRLGVVVEPTQPPPQQAETTADTSNKDNEDGNGGDEDDDDIDWEDGWENTVDQDNGIPEENDNDDDEPESHAAAVERTLAVIETTAGLQSGALEIDLNRQDPDTAANEEHAASEPATLLARARLVKCVGILSDRHMPRLAAWVEGLTCADGLVLQHQKDGAASCFVTMSQDLVHCRKDALGVLLELKSAVASILQSSQRLGIQQGATTFDATTTESREQGTGSSTTTTMAAQPAARHRQPVAINLASSTRHQGLATSFHRRQQRLTPNSDVSRHGSNRIQIKYRKT